MSSLLDAVLNSDAAPTPSSNVGTPRLPQHMRSSSARPRGPPSESAGANSDGEGFADDEVVGARIPGRRANAARTDIPRVVDVTGETLSLRFQEFLERSVLRRILLAVDSADML
jgi:DNA replication licensing factor MCM6